VMLRQDFFTKEICRLLHGGQNWLAEPKPANHRNKARLRTRNCGAAAFARWGIAGEGWSQSPVLPWTELAYETCLSAGSTAVLTDGHS
jgi:hypothetical protein